MTPLTTHPSALALDELLQGALPAGEGETAEAHLAACDACKRELEAARGRREHFAKTVLPRTLPLVRARLERSRVSSMRWLWALAPVAAAAALVLVFMPRTSTHHEEPFAVKGGPTFTAFARRGERVFKVADGVTLAPGDQVRFVAIPAGQTHLLIVSVDASGGTTVYFPFGGAESERLPADARVELPGSLVLDDAPGPERVFALFSRQPLRWADVAPSAKELATKGATAIRATHTLPVTASVQSSFVFEKASP